MSMPARTDTAEKTTFPWLANYAPEVDWSLDLPLQPMHAFLEQSIAQWPDRPALKSLSGAAYTYRELGALVDSAAAGLQNLGVARGMKVGLFMPNAAAAIVMYYAILKTGATVVNYNPAYAERDLVNQIADSDTALLVTLDAQPLLEKASVLLGKTDLRNLIVCPAAQDLRKQPAMPESVAGKDGMIRFADLLADAASFSPVDIDPENDIAVLQYTGGTTGVPKGAMLIIKTLPPTHYRSVTGSIRQKTARTVLLLCCRCSMFLR